MALDFNPEQKWQKELRLQKMQRELALAQRIQAQARARQTQQAPVQRQTEENKMATNSSKAYDEMLSNLYGNVDPNVVGGVFGGNERPEQYKAPYKHEIKPAEFKNPLDMAIRGKDAFMENFYQPMEGEDLEEWRRQKDWKEGYVADNLQGKQDNSMPGVGEVSDAAAKNYMNYSRPAEITKYATEPEPEFGPWDNTQQQQMLIDESMPAEPYAYGQQASPYDDGAKSINSIQASDNQAQVNSKLNSDKAGTAAMSWSNRGDLSPERIARNKAMYNAMGPLAGKGHPYDGVQGQDYRRARYDAADQRANGMLSNVAQQGVQNLNLERMKQGFLDVDPTTEYGRSEMLRMLGPDALNNLPQKYMSARQAGPGAKTVSDATPITSGQGVDAPQNMSIDIDWNRRVREAADANMRGENVPYPKREVQSSNRTPSSDPIPDYSSSFTRQPGAPANASAISGPLPPRDMRGDTYTSRVTGQPVFNQAKADRDSMRAAEITNNQLDHMTNQANYSSGGQESRWADQYGRDVTPPAQAIATPKTVNAASSNLGVNNMRDNMTPTNVGGDNPANFGGTIAKKKPDNTVNGFF